MVKIATFIVDKRNLFFLIYIVALIFSVFAKSWVKVDNELTDLSAGDYRDPAGPGYHG